MSDDDLRGLPSQLGRYELRSPLGRGGMGRVVLAHDPVLKRDVAIKLIELEALPAEQEKERRFLFHREARATAALRHPNIIEIYDYSGPDAAVLYLAVELCDGPTLREVLDRRRTLSANEVAALGHELCGALAHAHAQGIIHRDLKPENVFWLESGRIILADFGIAKPTVAGAETLVAQPTRLRGSPAYMAPEQLEGGVAGPASDVHALGALLFEALTGQPAFAGPDVEAIFRAILNEARPRLAGKAEAPTALVVGIEQALAKSPAERPTAAELQHRLRDALDELEVTDPRATLRHQGDLAPGVDEEPPALFDQEASTAIRVRHGALAAPRSRLAAALGRGPLMFGLLAVAALVGGVAYLVLTIGMLPDLSDFDRHEPPELLLSSNVDEVWALVRFPGEAKVFVDGREVGHWQEQVRLTLPPGPHTLAVHFPHGAVAREVMLLRETAPTFDFDPAEAVPLPVEATPPPPPPPSPPTP